MMLFLHVLMLILLSGGSARVVKNFEPKCHAFFAIGKSPTTFTGSQYKQICQTRSDVVHFATYYDTDNRIPVYSAYKFKGKMDCTRQNNWLIEPQLDGETGPNMASEGSVDKDLRGIHQALDGDYENSGFDRGHLAPVYQAQSQSCADATFTLTNAAPQDPSFNRGQWKELERNMAETLSKQCKEYSVFIVTGVTPGRNKIKTDRVNVPSHFWTAYCCLDKNGICQISKGFIGKNENNPPEEKNVNDLEKDLARLYGVTSFEVFDSDTEPIEPKPRKRIKLF
ncbi:endonuclease domain-containing 1 protein-like [Megalobrama amblycephala]|uniref:endonuclease domain-containing 1 protein-like n=1 Tax=Megalobrama amblycephala TaxID=75352 RepID=UPI0020140824|nr:endonuclease domain-containing 1 protein-like [Megalobrama amblycephala]